MVRLRVKNDYICRDLAYKAGAVIDVDDDLAAFLLVDSPGTFEEVQSVSKEVAEPPQDKAVKSPPRSKATRRRRKSNAKNDG